MPGLADKVKQAASDVADATKKGAAAAADATKKGAAVAADATKKGAGVAQAKAKLRGLRHKADEKAKELGYLVSRERGGSEAAGVQGDELISEIVELERQIEEVGGSTGDGEDDGS